MNNYVYPNNSEVNNELQKFAKIVFHLLQYEVLKYFQRFPTFELNLSGYSQLCNVQ